MNTIKKTILFITLIGALTSCQDKFEQIDANFAFLDEKLEANINDLQNQIDANKQAIAELDQKIDNDVNALEDYVDMHVEILTQVDGELAQNIAGRISEVNDAIELLQVADENIDVKIEELNAIQVAINTATASQVADLENNYAVVVNDLNNEVATLKTELLSHFSTISTDTALAVAEFLAAQQLDVTSIVIEIVGEVIEDVETPADDSDDSDEEEEKDDDTASIEDQVRDFLNSAPGTVVEINGATLTVASVNLYNVNVNGSVSWRAVTASVTFNMLLNDIVSLIQ